MNILFLTHRVPFPPNRGDRIRSYHILRFLSARVDVDLACLSDEPAPESSHDQLAALCRRIAIVRQGRFARSARALSSLAHGRSATEGLFHSPGLVRILEQWAADTRYHMVFAYCSSMGQYVNVGRLAQHPYVLDLVDVDSQKWFDYADIARGPNRWLYQLEGGRVRRLEQELARRAHAVTVVSTAEAGLLRKFCPHAEIQVVPNGVDLEYFKPEFANARIDGHESSAPARPACVFVGALDYLPNIDGVCWFAREVWPEVYGRFPQAKFILVGRRPVARIRRLARQAGVELVGEVADVRPHLRRASLVVVPLRIARGIQNKVLEALAAGRPVIASAPALNALGLAPDEHVYQADTPAQWITCVSKLLTDDDQRRKLAAAGRDFVSRHHHWGDCLQPLEEWLDIQENDRAEMSAVALTSASSQV